MSVLDNSPKGTINQCHLIKSKTHRFFLFIPSQRNKDKLAYKGYVYVCDRMKCSKSYWKCDQADCKGRCIQNRNFIQETKKDNHVPDPVNVTPLSAGTYVNAF